jgi:hypothetical protein
MPGSIDFKPVSSTRTRHSRKIRHANLDGLATQANAQVYSFRSWEVTWEVAHSEADDIETHFYTTGAGEFSCHESYLGEPGDSSLTCIYISEELSRTHLMKWTVNGERVNRIGPVVIQEVL